MASRAYYVKKRVIDGKILKMEKGSKQQLTGQFERKK